jgi:two-component system, LuxR family, response regulator FixJ
LEGLVAIVEDNEAVRDALETILGLEGYGVVAYLSGDDFINAVRERQPDCVLLDLFMPDGSGADVLEALDTTSTRVIIISAEDEAPKALAAINAGACDFIKKPFDADTVLERVRAALTNGRQGSRRQMSHQS